MIIFGGQNGTYYNNAVKYNPSSNTWTAIANAPEKKAYHTAVWTGTEMIVWGGDSSSVNPLAGTGITKTGYKYNPTLNTWSAAISTTGAPNARYDHGAVWTGTKMLIFAGTSYTPPSIVSSSYANYDLYAYDATGNTWSMLSSSFNETFHPRCVWTGTDMIAITPVYARVNNQLYTLLQKYNPGSDLWTNLANEGQYVSPGTVVWDGANMIITQGQLLQRFTLSGSGNYYYLPQLTSYYLMRKIYNY
jgi:N-acetylneuraminic acid mutarotase